MVRLLPIVNAKTTHQMIGLTAPLDLFKGALFLAVAGGGGCNRYLPVDRGSVCFKPFLPKPTTLLSLWLWWLGKGLSSAKMAAWH